MRLAPYGVIKNNWAELNHEDIGIIERMQCGRATDGFDGGVLSPYQDPALPGPGSAAFHNHDNVGDFQLNQPPCSSL